jgi:hypothetical protein
MPDVEKILRLVSEGALTPDEADEILNALNSTNPDTPQDRPARSSAQRQPQADTPRHLRIQVTERGRPVVNLRVPMNIASWASAYLPGLSDADTDRIRGAIASGTRGPIIDIGDDDDRVLITSE